MNIIAICSLADRPDMPPPLPGSELRPCEDCGRMCVLSPSTVKRDPRWILCHEHGMPLTARPELMLAPTPEAIADFLEDQRRQRAMLRRDDSAGMVW